MTLKEAIRTVLAEHQGGPLSSRAIADEIAARQLYRRGDGGNPPPSQISARANHHLDLFVKSDDGWRLKRAVGQSASYLQTWTGGVAAARARAGEPLDYAASNQYPSMGVNPGDTVYVVYLDDGLMCLIGRVLVGEVIDYAEAVRRRGEGIWQASTYVAAAEGYPMDTFVFDRQIPASVVRALEFERRSGHTTRLDVGRGGTIDGRALQRIRRLTPASAALLGNLGELESETRHGANRISADERRAIELRAMDVAKARYEDHGWTMEDVHLTRPYDLVANRRGVELHIEVKGSTGGCVAVNLTRNEVTHAQTYKNPVLALVSDIELERGDEPSATGGSLRLIEPWNISDGELEPLQFSYRPPTH